MREVTLERNTAETAIKLSLSLDGNGSHEISTGIGFFDHMLSQIAVHARFNLDVNCQGDLEVDAHHSVEDVGIVFGQALRSALQDKAGIQRYGVAYIPLDEALSRVVIDLSGRSSLYFSADFTAEQVGNFDSQLVREFFQAVVNHGQLALHIDQLRGVNCHHQIESIFKAFAHALRQAVTILEPIRAESSPAEPILLSTKGTL